jgi:hypothetical protein
VNPGILTSGYAPPQMPGGLLGVTTPVPMPGDSYAYDAEAADYIRRVEAADGQPLEQRVRAAINTFVVSLKADGTWPSIRACCVMMGARTLAGALTPLVGVAPTNANFVSGDYSRRTGLVGNGSTKNLNSNRAQNADPQDDLHMAVYVTAVPTNASTFPVYIGVGQGSTGDVHVGVLTNGNDLFVRMRNSTSDTFSGVATSAGLLGVARSGANWYAAGAGVTTRTFARASQTPRSESTRVFSGLNVSNGVASERSNARLSYYSIGRYLDLPMLRARLDRLNADIGAAV